jgi:uncharacterized glyoxalase superfamily protein PhnB
MITLRLFVRHGDETRAVAFYEAAFGAEVVERCEHARGAEAVTLRLGGAEFTVAGANPRRDDDPALGGPRSPQALGTTSVVLDLRVDDADRAVAAAVGAGATLRNPVEAVDARHVGVVIDPFGYIWAITSSPETKRQAACRSAACTSGLKNPSPL